MDLVAVYAFRKKLRLGNKDLYLKKETELLSKCRLESKLILINL